MDAGRALGRQDGCWWGAGEAGWMLGGCLGSRAAHLPHTHSAQCPGKEQSVLPCRYLQPEREPEGIHLPERNLHPRTSPTNRRVANGEKRPLRGRINLILRWLPGKGQMNCAWTCRFFSPMTTNVTQPTVSEAGTCGGATCSQVKQIQVHSRCSGSTPVLYIPAGSTGRQTHLLGSGYETLRFAPATQLSC